MKRLILLLLTGMVMSLSGFGKGKSKERDISGDYFDKSEYTQLSINGNHIRLTHPETDVVTGEFLGEFTFRWVDNQFIEINSISPLEIAAQGKSVRQFFDPTVSNDSVKVSFILPYSGPLKISVSGAFKGNNYPRFREDSIYSEEPENRNLMILKKDIESIWTSISPGEFLYPQDYFAGFFYGVMRYVPTRYDYKLEDGMNHIEIKLPAIDNSFFQRYYAKGEYARVWKDTITWKGIVYKKGQ